MMDSSTNLVSLLYERTLSTFPAIAFTHTVRSNLTLSLAISDLTTVTPASKHSTISLDVDKDEEFLLGGDKKGGIAVYDITKKNVHGINQYQSVCSVSSESQHSHEFSANTVAWYPHDNGMFISCSYDNHVKVWDTNTMKPVEDFTVGRVSHVSMSTKKGKTSSLIACALSDNTVKLCDMTSGASTHVLRGHVASVNTVVWSKRNQYALFSSGKDGKIITYDIRRSTPAIHFFDHANRGSSETAHSGEVTSLTQTECGLYLVSSSNDRQIRVWNTNSGLNTMTNFDPMQTSQATTVTAALSTSACYPGLLYLPLGSNISIYDSLTGSKLGDLSGHFGKVTCVKFIRGQLQLVSCSHDGTVLIWEPPPPEESANTANIYTDTWSSDDDLT